MSKRKQPVRRKPPPPPRLVEMQIEYVASPTCTAATRRLDAVILALARLLVDIADHKARDEPPPPARD